MKKESTRPQDYTEKMFSRLTSFSTESGSYNYIVKRIPGKLVSGGCYGSYYRYSKTHGLKVITELKYESKFSFKYALNHRIMRQVFEEVALFNLFYGKELASVVIAFEFNHEKRIYYYYPAILMPHFTGKHAGNLKNILYNPNLDCIMNKKDQAGQRGLIPVVFAILQCGNKSGIFFHDVHSGNVIIDKDKRPWVIDFSSELIQYFGNPKKLETKVAKIRNRFKTQILEMMKKSA